MERLRASGVSSTSAQAHEHRHSCEVLRQAIAIYQLDVTALSSFEQVGRRLVQMEMAVSKNPRRPAYTGLGVVADGPVAADGSARVSKFTAWTTERQKERANILKQQRLYDEEQEAKRRAEGGGGGGASSSTDGGAGRGGNPRGGRARARGRGRGANADANDSAT